ncbi:hypothetical protein CVT25_005404, partial [Psilocybe cyanescens]
MSSIPRETFRHLQKAWDLAHTAPFVEDQPTHENARALLKRMQKYLSNHLSQYDDAEYVESAFAIRVRRTLGQRIFQFVSTGSSIYRMYHPYFLCGPFTPENTILWEVQDLASAAGLGIAPSIAPPVIRPTQAIASATELEVSKQRSQGKGKARAPTPPSPLASPNLVLNRQPSLRPQDLLELI